MQWYFECLAAFYTEAFVYMSENWEILFVAQERIKGRGLFIYNDYKLSLKLKIINKKFF